MAARGEFYHGTVAGLLPGDLITPGHEPVHAVSRPGRVYFTADPAWALVYACHAMHAGGWQKVARVYEVRPLASRTFRDFSLFGGAPCVARWSCQPLAVLGEVRLDERLGHLAARLRAGQGTGAADGDGR